jgi:hypothetical protein
MRYPTAIIAVYRIVGLEVRSRQRRVPFQTYSGMSMIRNLFSPCEGLREGPWDGVWEGSCEGDWQRQRIKLNEMQPSLPHREQA